jgi:hypothetical protein
MMHGILVMTDGVTSVPVWHWIVFMPLMAMVVFLLELSVAAEGRVLPHARKIPDIETGWILTLGIVLDLRAIFGSSLLSRRIKSRRRLSGMRGRCGL